MRLPASRVYRAFAELDRFSDEQCERFLAAATKGLGRWLGTFFLESAGALGVSLVFVWPVLLAARSAPVSSIANRFGNLSILVALLVVLAPGGITWLIIKDRLLRRRIRRVINTRGSCGSCGYVLTGLPVGPDLGVVCPECGFRLAVEANLGEVVEAEGGVRRFMPSPEVVPPLLRWLTPRRKKRFVRLTLGVSAALAALLVLSWGGYEWFLWRQAASAKAARIGVEGLIEFVEKHQTKGADANPKSPDAWDAFYEASGAISQHDRASWGAGLGSSAGVVWPDFSELYAPTSPDADEDTVRRTAQSRDLARGLIDDYRAAGVYAKFDEMAARRRAVRPIAPVPAGQPPIGIQGDELGQVRNMARINAARMKLAADRGDQVEFVSAMEANFALVRMCRHGPFLMDRHLAAAVETLTFEQVRRALVTRGDRAWIESIQGAVDRQGDDVPYETALEGEKLLALDTVAWYFEEPSRARAGRFAKPLKRITTGWSSPSDESGSLGTYVQNRDFVISRFAVLISQVRLEPWQRAPAATATDSGLLLVDLLTPTGRPVPFTADLERVHERGLAVLLALERFRCEGGSYPQSLDELAPSFLPALPLDPWSGRSFVYRRLETQSAGRPAYLLYSVGADGTDNGGMQTGGRAPTEALTESGAGTDFVLSPPWDGGRPER